MPLNNGTKIKLLNFTSIDFFNSYVNGTVRIFCIFIILPLLLYYYVYYKFIFICY